MSTEAPVNAPVSVPAAGEAPKADAAGAAAGAGAKSNVAGAPYRSAALYVGDLHPEVTEATLFEIFNAVAPVASVRVCRHAITRRSLGYAYINFHTVRDAERVLDTMNYTMIKGRMCRLMWSQRDPSLRKSGQGNVFIKNLDPTIDSKDLFDTFSIFGNIISCKVVTDRATGTSRGYGFVHFETQEAANEAIAKVNGNVISGRVVYVGNFVKRDQRLNSQEWTNLYVKNIPDEWDDAKVSAMFTDIGEVESALFVKDEKTNKRFGYVDYKEHAHAKLAVDTLHEKEVPWPKVEGEEVDPEAEEKPARKFYVSRFMKRRERERVVQDAKMKEKAERIKMFLGKNLYIRNLADEVTDELLREEFAPFGTITSARVMRDDKNNRNRGFGFVCFSSREEAAKALHTLNNMMFMNKPLYVAMWQPQEERRQFLQRQHLAKTGRMQMPGPMNAMARSGGIGYAQMMGAPLGMYPQGPPGARGYPRPMYPQRGPMPGPYQMQPGYGQPMQAGMYPQMMQQPGGPRGPRGGQQRGGQRGQQRQQQPSQQQMQQYQATQQSRNMPMPGQQMPPQQMPMQMPPADAPLTPAALAAASPEVQKNMIGERLYPLVQAEEPQLAGKVTGMLLDGMETTELLHLLESADALRSKIMEAMTVLEAANQEEEPSPM